MRKITAKMAPKRLYVHARRFSQHAQICSYIVKSKNIRHGLSNAPSPMHFRQKLVENGQFEIFVKFHFFKNFEFFAKFYPNLAKFTDFQIGRYQSIFAQNTSKIVRLKALD